eukprot:CAMPEP_0115338430 /NCGR_PEP_ID=MMETSP0270-20121206/90065_1 /TAXON_ID=71861 /ORGANISM="Scrippsiella trochoidea, Strain CCMP3099" /LENGTH=381 /DNA_ID=CAMNT_0002759729 /DNA_START=17 /DNA_END=1159 /DNA_ORIENTATION=+
MSWLPAQIQAVLLLALATWTFQRVHGVAVCGSSFTAESDLSIADAGNVRALAYIDDGNGTNLLVAGGEDTIMRVWTLSPLSTTPREYKGHHETIWALEWISELDVLASGCGDGTIHLWPTSVLTVSQPCTGVADCCDGSGLGCRGEHVLGWRLTDLTKRRQIHSLEWVSNGDGTGTLVSGWGDGGVRTWTYDGSAWAFGLDLQPDEYDQKDRTYDMVWMSGQSVLATASEDWPFPRLWSSLNDTGQFDYLTKQPGEGVCPGSWEHCDAVLAIDADATGTMLASGSRDNTIILWDAATKAKYAQLTSHTDYVTSLVWLHSDDKIASGSADSTIQIWDATVTSDTSSSDATLTGHSGSVNAMVWIPEHALLASADSDGNVKLW